MSVTILETFEKDPDDALNYGFDWNTWLPSGDTIATSTWSVTPGITNTGSTNSGGQTTTKISGGTLGQMYLATNVITTTTSQETKSASLAIRIVQK